MDFTKFSDDNFDLKEWINSAFVSQKETNQNQEVGSLFFTNFFFAPYKCLFLCLAIRRHSHNQTTGLYPGIY
jgi:hypothetical protein